MLLDLQVVWITGDKETELLCKETFIFIVSTI